MQIRNSSVDNVFFYSQHKWKGKHFQMCPHSDKEQILPTFSKHKPNVVSGACSCTAVKRAETNDLQKGGRSRGILVTLTEADIFQLELKFAVILSCMNAQNQSRRPYYQSVKSLCTYSCVES